MNASEAHVLIGHAHRIDLIVTTRERGREIQIRVGDGEWQRGFKPAVLEILMSVPAGAAMPMFQDRGHHEAKR